MNMAASILERKCVSKTLSMLEPASVGTSALQSVAEDLAQGACLGVSVSMPYQTAFAIDSFAAADSGYGNPHGVKRGR